MAAFLAAIVAFAQWNFTVDTTFQAEVEGKNINDLMVMPDGKIFLSGRIRFLGDDFDRGSSKLLANGARDMSFPSFPETTGGGKITPWENSFYVSNGLVRRLNSDGLIDPAFISLNLGLYFYSLQGGDYHVFPDGRVLISGNHLLSDSVRGFEGLYQLVWFTNTGYLDTTRIHRSSGNCAVYRFEELPSGQFIVRGICDQFDGQPVDRIFRVHADGSVDTSYHTGVYWGAAYDYLPLADGRVYVAGEYLRTAEPGDTLHLARFLSTGQLDPSFLPPQFTMLSSLATFGCGVERIEPWLNGTLLATGQFSSVNGQPRNGICILDTNGTLLPAFGGQGVGTYTESFSGGSYRYATIAATAYDSTNAHLYIAGAYSGYTDATGHYPDQRFITRLKVSELSTAVPDQAPQRGSLQLWPNPAAGQVWLRYALPGHQGQVHLRVRDSQGRVLFLTPAAGEEGQVVWDSRGVAPGVYTVELLREGKLERSERLIIQP
jgi:hypothetical protein